MVINPQALARLTAENQIRYDEDLRAFEAMDARREIQEDVDRDILDILRRQEEAARLQPMPLTRERPDEGAEFRLGIHARYGPVQPMATPRFPNFGPPTAPPPELTVKRAEPEVHRRTRFERIDDD
jgi:hypothetical protein